LLARLSAASISSILTALGNLCQDVVQPRFGQEMDNRLTTGVQHAGWFSDACVSRQQEGTYGRSCSAGALRCEAQVPAPFRWLVRTDRARMTTHPFLTRVNPYLQGLWDSCLYVSWIVPFMAVHSPPGRLLVGSRGALLPAHRMRGQDSTRGAGTMPTCLLRVVYDCGWGIR
jgi:hypothetical protein